MATGEAHLLTNMFPELATELQELLSQKGEPELAAQISGLKVLDRCRCGDDFCGMFYVLPKPRGAYGPGHRNIPMEPNTGMMILDVVGDKIAAVEVLYRNEVRRRLLMEFP